MLNKDTIIHNHITITITIKRGTITTIILSVVVM